MPYISFPIFSQLILFGGPPPPAPQVETPMVMALRPSPKDGHHILLITRFHPTSGPHHTHSLSWTFPSELSLGVYHDHPQVKLGQPPGRGQADMRPRYKGPSAGARKTCPDDPQGPPHGLGRHATTILRALIKGPLQGAPSGGPLDFSKNELGPGFAWQHGKSHDRLKFLVYTPPPLKRTLPNRPQDAYIRVQNQHGKVKLGMVSKTPKGRVVPQSCLAAEGCKALTLPKMSEHGMYHPIGVPDVHSQGGPKGFFSSHITFFPHKVKQIYICFIFETSILAKVRYHFQIHKTNITITKP